jgi:hypothetical protein
VSRRAKANEQCSDTAGFSIPQARAILQDLFKHNASRYWAHFICSLVVGYGAAIVYLRAPLFPWQQAVFYFLAGFALFRLGSFIHEIAHMSGQTLLAFRVAWNVLAGIPMMMPSFMYGNHVDHHSSRYYGTGQDGEYLPLGSGVPVLRAQLTSVYVENPMLDARGESRSFCGAVTSRE